MHNDTLTIWTHAIFSTGSLCCSVHRIDWAPGMNQACMNGTVVWFFTLIQTIHSKSCSLPSCSSFLRDQKVGQKLNYTDHKILPLGNTPISSRRNNRAGFGFGCHQIWKDYFTKLRVCSETPTNRHALNSFVYTSEWGQKASWGTAAQQKWVWWSRHELGYVMPYI